MATEAPLPQPVPFLSPGFFTDPYPLYAWLRRTDLVHWDDPTGLWLVSRYADVAAALNDPRLTRGSTAEQDATLARQLAAEGQSELRPVYGLLSSMMLFADPPKHTRLRGLTNRAFTPRVVEAMRPRIQAIVDGLLDAVQPDGRFDAIGDLAYPLPVVVICELLGLPPADRDRFKRWSDDIIAFAASVAHRRDEARRALSSTIELTAYVHATVARLRRHPDDTLMSALVAAEEQGDRLSEAELVANAVLLLMNGHETTTFQIGNGLLALLRHPDQLQLLRDNPALIAGAVEELLRYDGAVQMRGLGVAADLEIGGQAIGRGQTAMLLIGAANRDPAQFADPDRLDITRRETRHLDFGRGIHFCIAAALARAEVQIAIGSVLRRMPDLRLATEALQWQTVPVFRGLKTLPLDFAC